MSFEPKNDGYDPITVAELIEQLQKLPPTARVLVEGCDCTGDCSGATGDDEWVTVNRQPEEWKRENDE